MLIIVGAWSKMAFFLMHGWLTNAYTYAPTASGALLAPLATKVSVCAMLRIMITVLSIDYIIHRQISRPSPCCFRQSPSCWLFLFADANEPPEDRLFFYCLRDRIRSAEPGWPTLPVPRVPSIMWSPTPMTSAIFMVIGCIIYRLGSRSQNSTACTRMPVTFIAPVITMAALIGVPPTCGFFSKFYLIKRRQAGTWHFVIALPIST